MQHSHSNGTADDQEGVNMSDIGDIKTVGECVTRNGVSKIGLMRVAVDCDTVKVSFVSGKLSRSLHAGFSIPVSSMDELCDKWGKWRNGRTTAPKDDLILALNSAHCAIVSAIKTAELLPD